MSVLARLQQQAAAVADKGLDMSQVSKGGAGRRLLPAGRAYARLIGYREFGNHIQTYQGKAKAPARVVRLTFAMWGKANPLGENVQDNCYHLVNEDGTVKSHGTFTTFDISLGNSEKSRIKHGFDKMNWSKKHKTFATMLGEAFLLPIEVKKGTKADSKPYNLIDWAGILPPLDPMTAQPYQIPDVKDEDYFAFLWDMPTKEDWDAMFIDGTNDKGQSKNFLQAMCLKAKDFPGSALETLLLEINGGVLPDMGMVETDEDPDGDDGAQEAPQGAQAPSNVPPVPQADPSAAAAVAASMAVPAVPADVPFDGGSIPETPTVPATPTAIETPAVPSIPGIPGL